MRTGTGLDSPTPIHSHNNCACALNRRESSSGKGGEVAVRVRPLIQREIKAIYFKPCKFVLANMYPLCTVISEVTHMSEVTPTYLTRSVL